jgi:hypothetical protein
MTTIRRVVTGNDSMGRSYIVTDERVGPGELWRCGDGFPLGVAAGEVAASLPSTAPRLEPPVAGNSLYRVAFRPWAKVRSGYEEGLKPGFDKDGFHRTASLDYLYVLDGELELLLDEGATLLYPGDVVIQRNTNHAWRNHTDAVVNALAVMIKLDDQI